MRVAGEAGVLSTGYADEGTLRRLDLRVGVHGSHLSGLAEAIAVAVTVGLQHGAPAAEYVSVLRLAVDPGSAEPVALDLLTAGAGR
ncbi:hypothetical protein ACQEVZ_55180 [Dactylosporangium sp. CA-152071]|uniref:hypothetical protein n=1 Tax=Dactylosporangium sp. CA-152071 TaxID=3239933 RepID=UPI003D8B78F6